MDMMAIIELLQQKRGGTAIKKTVLLCQAVDAEHAKPGGEVVLR